MPLNQLKSAVHKRFNQVYLYECNEDIDFSLFKKGSIVIANDTSIVSILAFKTYLTGANLTVLDSFDNRAKGLEKYLTNTGISYIEHISFWDRDSVLIVNTGFISQVEQSDDRFILCICGVELPHFSERKNLDRQVFFDVAKLQSLRTFNEEFENLSVKTWEEYLLQLNQPAEIWFRQMLNAGTHRVISDTTGVDLDGHKFATASILMAKKLSKLTESQGSVGVCLPTSAGGYLAIMALMISAKSIVNLNYTASEEALHHAITNAGIKTIITSKAFVEKLAGKGFMVEKVFSMCQVVYLEDIKASITKFDSLLTYLQVKYLPENMLVNKYVAKTKLEDLAFIIYSSGSEGVPKGIAVSHKNLLANVYQSTKVIECSENDSVAGILPIFHAFGLTISLVSFFQGGFIACHTDPTDAKGVANLISKYKVTVLCATPTFLRIYTKNRTVKKEDLATLRYIVTGAEKLSKEVRTMFEAKFDKVISEGYGTTELSPVAAVNRPTKAPNKIGTVGLTVPGGQFKIVHPESHEELPLGTEGMVVYRGVNKMDYYLNDPAKTKKVMLDMYGHSWYITGDKGKLDSDGYLTVVDRYSRFAKIAGEMVSLGLLEQQVYDALREKGYDSHKIDFEILAVATPDAKRGEIINLLYTLEELAQDELKDIVRHSNIENLYRPSNYFKVIAIPKLGSGKTDFSKAKKLALDLVKA
ncbi:iglABCD operon regulator MigR [Francisella adeliensis]|uniref:AMP-binding protein n=1 Tax=Francisella adeliensis TaxID=2007306 RepID=A0A2Z4XZ11_9GAMM|nr:AMP-binding protein [Francisella adeliensis]AXA34029.1 AMP-binding protein [Francisella adeliensis]MBK2085189.1 AMP-binding protein [Francisella adeliensis]MBK2096043.1 AMP-binding protein [Francisella adeliensis]QIW12266.1 AMP-binding protein [Francisella adeliensis]QIW14141.1 AMP-binding protein [Francisella adeliensis]